MELGLEDRVCVVTGGSRGIGRETAAALCGEGAAVLLVGRDAEALAEAEGLCATRGGRCAALAADVTAEDAPRRIAAAGAALGPIAALVNCAGAAAPQPLEQVPDRAWREAWELNVMAPMRLMRELTPPMRERGWGRVVNVASSAAKRPAPATPEYSVTKAALLSLSRLFADACAADGVLVNAICPGPVKTEMWLAPGGQLDLLVAERGLASREEALALVGGQRPIGRLAEPGEIAAAIVFLCSAAAGYVAGAAWSVDGGSVAVIV